MKNHIGKIFAVLAVVAVGGAIVYSNYVSNQANQGVSFEAHVKGNPTATVTLTEYSDFQCPACAAFVPYVAEMVDMYGDSLQVEYKHFPLITIHPYAVPAARAAEAAGQQGKFWEMHDVLFENQQIWSNSGNPIPMFFNYAEQIGLDMDTFRQHMRSSRIEEKVNDEYKEARSLGLTGTPSFFLNGERMQFETFDDFRAQIAAAVGGVADNGENETAPAAAEELDVQFGI